MKNTQASARRNGLWRWIFVCSQTACLALLAIYIFQSHRGYKYVDHFYYPIRAALVDGTFLLTTLFLFFVSPFFFRRLGILAVTAWISALVAFVWISLPVF